MEQSIILTERFDERKLRYIHAHFDQLPLRDETKNPKNTTYNPVKIIEGYLRKSIGGEITVTYQKAGHGIGRYFAKHSHSLANIPREIRHTIAADYYYDIDMVNAHPAILQTYCTKQGLSCSELSKYVAERDTLLQEFMEQSGLSREECKNIILAITNGGKLHNRSKCPGWVQRYEVEMQNIHKYVSEHEKLVMDVTKKKGKTYNMSGSAVNLLLCQIENELLMSLYNYAKELKLITNNAVLVFDGIMLYKPECKHIDMTPFLRDAEARMYEDTGYFVSLKEKPMTNQLPLPTELPTIHSTEIVIQDEENEAANIFLEMIKDDIRCCEGQIFFKKDGIWLSSDQQVKRALLDRCLKANMVKINKDTGEIKPYSSVLSHAKSIVEATMCRVPETPTFLEDLWWDTKGKLVFLDGYWDFKTKQFCKGVPNTGSTIQIQRPFPSRNEKIIQAVYDRVLYPILGDLTVPFLQYLARAVAGHCEDKVWGVMMGERDCGKGVLGVLLYTAFEKYVVTLSAESLVCERVHTSGDEAKKLSWIVPMQFSRIALTNEIRIMEDVKLMLDGNIIKKIASGGDMIMCRLLYQNERMIRIMATLLMACNDLPKVTPADAYEKIVPFSCPHKFVENCTSDMLSNFPFYRKADPSIKESFCRLKDAGDALFWIITDYYKEHPVILTDAMQNFKDQFRVVDESSSILKYFHVTGNANDKVPSSEVTSLIKNKGLNMSLQKFSSVMEKYRVQNKLVKVNGKPVRCYIGLVKLNDDDHCGNIDED